MLCNSHTSIKLHLLLIICVIGSAYFMYQLYNECKSLERELILSKKQIEILTLRNKQSNEEIIIVDDDVSEEDTCKDTSTKSEKEKEKVDSDINFMMKKIYSTADDTSDEDEDEEKCDAQDTQCDTKCETQDTQCDTKCVAQDTKCEDSVKTTVDYSKMSKKALNKIKINDLKQYLKSSNLDTQGTKTEIIDKIISL